MAVRDAAYRSHHAGVPCTIMPVLRRQHSAVYPDAGRTALFAFCGREVSKRMKKVAIIMGSDSDWPVVKAACTVLKDFGIPFEAHILSAHRTPGSRR